MLSLLRLERKQKNFSKPFRIRIFLLSFLLWFGTETINTLIHSCSCRPKRCQTPTRWGGKYLYGLYKGVPPRISPIPFPYLLRTPENSNCFRFYFKVRVIESRLYGMFVCKLYVCLSDFAKTWPLGFRFAPGAARLQASPVFKKVGGLSSWSVHLDSPGTALTVGRWIRPGGQN